MGDDGARPLSPLFSRRAISWDRRAGAYSVDLDPQAREVLRRLAPQITDLLDDPDRPALQRLFPPAYSEVAYAEHQEEYRRLMQEDLVERHREQLDLLASTADARSLSEEQLVSWSRALNSVRLVLGTFLDVSEGDEAREPSSPEEALYVWLTALLGEAIEALSGQT